MLARDLYSEEHELFRAQFRRFAAAEIAPRIERWNREGTTDKATWRKTGEAGFLGAAAPAPYGGAGGDFLFDAVLMEEMARIRAHAMMLSLHSDVCMPYLVHYGTEEQKRKYLPGAISGEMSIDIAMNEHGAGTERRLEGCRRR